MSDDSRSIELEIEVPGTPDEVWQAIASGPGISSWYVPHVVEEREGGAMSASFGPGMDIPGRVAAWEPPHRIVFEGEDGGEGVEGLAYEWLVEARDGGTCIVRLVNSGFGDGADWDAQYDGMSEGWLMFLCNLRLHLEHFMGQAAKPMLPGATWAGPRDVAWARLTDALGLPTTPAVGERVEVTAPGAPELAGEVAEVAHGRMSLVIDKPAAGTAFVVAEGAGDTVEVSVWAYLYGPDGAAAVDNDEPRWRQWLAERGVTTG